MEWAAACSVPRDRLTFCEQGASQRYPFFLVDPAPVSQQEGLVLLVGHRLQGIRMSNVERVVQLNLELLHLCYLRLSSSMSPFLQEFVLSMELLQFGDDVVLSHHGDPCHFPKMSNQWSDPEGHILDSSLLMLETVEDEL